MCAYTYITFGGAKTQLSARLHDASNVFFTDTGTYPEIELYLKEALRVWQVLTAYWREEESLSTAASTPFYDLRVELATTRPFTIYDRELVAEIQYHFLEPATPTAWSGTEQFTLADLTTALQRRRDQFLAETGLHLTHDTQAAAAGTITLPEATIDVRRIAWVTAGGSYTPITREDEWALQAYDSGWQTAAVPYAYSVASSAPVTLELAPPPSVAGTLDIVSVRSGATLNPVTPVLMGIPDDYCWVVKWGAMADLLGKDGPAYDPQRSAFCEQRYQQGVTYARNAICVIQAQIEGGPVPLTPLSELDMYNPNWQNVTEAQPTSMLSMGLNLVAFSPVPDVAYTITLDVLPNAPIPANDAAALQLGPEELNAILGYAEHLAMFKVAGTEFEATQPLYDNFLKVAQAYKERLGAMVRYAEPLAVQSMKEEIVNKRREAPSG